MTREPFIAYNEFTNEIYIISGRDKYCVTEQVTTAVNAIKAPEQEPVLDKIRQQMVDHLRGVTITLEVLVENDPLRLKMEGAKNTLEECLELIDKYKADRR